MKLNSVEIFIATRLSRESVKSKNHIMVSVATISVAISVAVMIVALSVIVGFKSEITSKIVGFNSHMTISNLDSNRSYSSYPISKNQPFIDNLRDLDGVESVSGFTIKSGVLENDKLLEGIVLKGVDSNFDTTFLSEALIDGKMLDLDTDVKQKNIIISSTLANLLKIKLGDKARMMFIENPPRRDAFIVTGIYNTSMAEYDKIMIFTDIRNVNRLSGWGDDSLSGFDIRIENLELLPALKSKVEDIVFSSTELDEMLIVEDVAELNGAMFEWLNLQDLNVVVVSFIMLFVAGFNMISMILILLLEKRSMIGVFKTIGVRDSVIQKIFIFRALYVTVKGVLWGVFIGVSLCLIQQWFGVITLSESAYFMSEVPIIIKPMYIIFVALGSIVITTIIQIIPTFIVSKITPLQNVNYR